MKPKAAPLGWGAASLPKHHLDPVGEVGGAGRAVAIPGLEVPGLIDLEDTPPGQIEGIGAEADCSASAIP
jgi:hypothetical protein